MIRLKYPLILASKSPRRQKLMRDAGFEFTIQTIPVKENYPDDLSIPEIPVYLARKKAEALAQVNEDNIIISADTIVTLGPKILGKPKSREDAQKMLNLLSSKTHLVYSGVCIAVKKEFTTFLEVTEVTFRKLKRTEINYYIEHFAPFDKAGAYGIQEWIGLTGIEKIKGSYYNVVGLPVCELYNTLDDLGLLSI